MDFNTALFHNSCIKIHIKQYCFIIWKNFLPGTQPAHTYTNGKKLIVRLVAMFLGNRYVFTLIIKIFYDYYYIEIPIFKLG